MRGANSMPIPQSFQFNKRLLLINNSSLSIAITEMIERQSDQETAVDSKN